MDKTSLGNRMKQYEASFNQKLPPRIPLMLRLDGVGFSKMVKKWKCKKPYDLRLANAMQQASLALAEKISGTCLVYSQSDEITMLIRDDMSNDTQPWHGKKINKILTIASTTAANAFNYYFFGPEYCDSQPKLSYLAEFDCRSYIVPEHEIFNSILWRQQDCTKNSISMLAQTLFSHKNLHKKSGSEKQDMMMIEHGVNWNDMPTAFKRGFCVKNVEVPKQVPKRDENHKVIEGEFETVNRNKWVIDLEPPIFTKDRNYINQYAKIAYKDHHKQMNIGFDIHGVTDKNPVFKSIARAMLAAGHKIHIITGSPMSKAKKDLEKLGMVVGEDYNYIFSITEYLIEKGVEVTWKDPENPMFPDDEWNKAKARYCQLKKIDIHFDDSDIYGKYFTTLYAQIN